MNRIILIGNGFDLAHELRTSYKYFLDDYWKDITERIKAHREPREFKTYELVYNKFPHSLYKEDTDIRKTQVYKNIGFKNLFLKHITDRSNLEDWVDIENEYYRLLKNTYILEERDPTIPDELLDISKLNSDFSEITELLRKYLIEQIKDFNKNFHDPKLQNSVGPKIFSEFQIKDFTEDYQIQRSIREFDSFRKNIGDLEAKKISLSNLNEYKAILINHLGHSATLSKIRSLLTSNVAGRYWDLFPDNILFLNFNYTQTELKYHGFNHVVGYESKKINTQYIHIHGTIEDKDSIIFGFGDELDVDYKSIERLNDNRYLDNIKSIRYLDSEEYKKLLQFINSDEYQIFIFGHSCGISDRTLLNTLFEHKNCVSIKPFYYKNEDETDNYSDIVKNISRSFNDKILMRDKVVNKQYCKPLVE